MSDTRLLRTCVSSEVKARVHAVAEQQFIKESVWLRTLVITALRELALDETTVSRKSRTIDSVHRSGVLQTDGEDKPGTRLAVRLHPEDRLLLRERANARGMPSATYVSVLVRAHLRQLAALPKDELLALKASVAELAAIGRNLNQLARAAHGGDGGAGATREDLWAMLKACEATRAHVKALIRANVNSWDVGHAESESKRR
jgi:hypothetical protein